MIHSFEDNAILGRFVGPTVNQVAQAEELRCAYQEIERLKADLLECREYLELHVDVIDGSDGPLPNRAMALVSMIDESLHGPGNF